MNLDIASHLIFKKTDHRFKDKTVKLLEENVEELCKISVLKINFEITSKAKDNMKGGESCIGFYEN